VDACLACHDDAHSRAFPSSPHGATWRQAAASPRPAAAEVSCATCHLPRVATEDAGGRRVAVHHRNTLTLRPPDRMAKLVCTDCHGLPFALASLLDPRLVANNFRGRPERPAESIEMVGALAAGAGGGQEGTR